MDALVYKPAPGPHLIRRRGIWQLHAEPDRLSDPRASVLTTPPQEKQERDTRMLWVSPVLFAEATMHTPAVDCGTGNGLRS